MEQIWLIVNFPAQIWKNIKNEIREIFQTYFGAKLLNHFDNVVIIQNKFWYLLGYREGLEAVLQQQTEDSWKATHFASGRFLTTFDQKYSINKLELLAVVWAIEKFRNSVYRTQFEVVSDHKALTAILEGNGAIKTYSSRLTCWIDRLLQFQFTVKHEPGRTLGMADYLSRHPSPSNNQAKAEEFWNNWLTEIM